MLRPHIFSMICYILHQGCRRTLYRTFQWIKHRLTGVSPGTVQIWIPQTDREKYVQIANSLYEWRQKWQDRIDRSFKTSIPSHLNNGKLKVSVAIVSDLNILKSLPTGINSQIIPPLHPVWSLVANVKNATYSMKGIEIRGSKHFEPGSAVYPCRRWSGDGYERPYVVGLQRDTHKFISIVCPSSRLENWRVELVENPIVIFQLRHTTGGWDGSDGDREEAQLLADGMNRRAQ